MVNTFACYLHSPADASGRAGSNPVLDVFFCVLCYAMSASAFIGFPTYPFLPTLKAPPPLTHPASTPYMYPSLYSTPYAHTMPKGCLLRLIEALDYANIIHSLLQTARTQQQRALEYLGPAAKPREQGWEWHGMLGVLPARIQQWEWSSVAG